MFSRDRWQEIFQTISKNKLRTFLTGFAVALGIFIFVVLVGFGNGLKNTFQEFFLDDATNTLFLFAGKTTKPYKGFKSNRFIQWENSDLDDIKKNFPMFLQYITPRITRGAFVKYKNESNNYTTRAVSPGHQYVEKTIMMKGRYLNQYDIENRTKNVVIGRLVAKDLFKDEDPIGKYIDMGDIAWKVVGVFQDDGGDNEERYIYLSYTTRQLIEKNNDKLGQIIVAFKPELGHQGGLAFERSLSKFLKDKKNIAPDDQGGIFIRNVADQLKQNQQFATVLQWIFGTIAIGTLIFGMIGVGTIMLFVVKERTKELGIRKALGATPKSVINMVLQEAVFITTIAGYVGMFLGIGVLSGIKDSLDEYFIKNPYIGMGTAIFATILLILFGALAGFIPARRAARIKPIEALRDE
ncbi:ABC transporter permease [Spongiivirga sp. MCCC 1A20706]|uniref:ABC transporter permease n=1 Tax=Spongiivirga sp. MCCC 1A20706 TaxID=3160963 RepID=UPI0039773E3D